MEIVKSQFQKTTVRIKCSNTIKNLVLSQLLVTVNCFYLAQQSCRGSGYLKDKLNLKKKKKKKIVLKELTHHRKKMLVSPARECLRHLQFNG